MSFPSLADLDATLPSTQEQQQGWGTPLPNTPIPTQPSQTHEYDQHILQFEEWRERVAIQGQRAGPPPMFLGEDHFTRLVQTRTQQSFTAVPPRDQRLHTPQIPTYQVNPLSPSSSIRSLGSGNGGYRQPQPLPVSTYHEAYYDLNQWRPRRR